MGARVNYGFTSKEAFEGNTLYLYLHWGDYDVAQHLADALKETYNRWDDPAYGIRRAVNLLISNDGGDPVAETGSGFTINTIGDGYIAYIVDWDEQTVYDDSEESWSFHEFIEFAESLDKGTDE